MIDRHTMKKTPDTDTVVEAHVNRVQENQKNEQEEVIATIEKMTGAFARGDIETVMSVYAPDAAIVGEADQPMRGEVALRAMFASHIEAGTTAFAYGGHDVIVVGNIALHLMKWTAPLPTGAESSALSIAVLRRHLDNGWEIVIDHPFGDAVMGER